MSKGKFRYNPKTLSYEKLERSWGERILLGFIYIAPTLVLSIIFGFIIAYRIDSPKEKRLRAELAEVETELVEWQMRMERIDRITKDIKRRD